MAGGCRPTPCADSSHRAWLRIWCAPGRPTTPSSTPTTSRRDARRSPIWRWSLAGCSCASTSSTTRIFSPNVTVAGASSSAGRTRESFTASLAWFDHAIDDRIQQIGATALVQCAVGLRTDCPDGIGILPLTLGAPDPRLGLGVQFDPNAPIEEALLQRGYANFGHVDLRGAELRLSARRELRDLGSLEARFDAVYLDSRRTDGPCAVFDECLGNPSLPRVRALLELAWTRGDFTLGWQLRHTGGTSSTAGVDPLDGYDGPARLPSWTVHDAQLRWRAPWQAEFAFGVRNLFDRAPVVDPVDPTGEGYDLALYEGAGRTPYLQYRQTW
ncbi:MAG: TonB-dependent receptor [Rhodanobacteraceae bacterium]|nr:TonB-dependent receptor [Rhodanobacteraceae bacterium]